MTMIFAVLAGRVTENNNRTAHNQKKIIAEQSETIKREKEVLRQ